MTMRQDPWTKQIPEPGDFDEYLATIDPAELEWCVPNPSVRIRILDDESELPQPPAVSR